LGRWWGIGGVGGREAEEDEANGDGGDGELECGEMEEGNAKRLGGCVFFLVFFSEEQTEGINGVVTSTGFQPRNMASKVRALP
jgi:hypothetical protein